MVGGKGMYMKELLVCWIAGILGSGMRDTVEL